MKYLKLLILAPFVLLLGCEPEFDIPTPASGDADFSTYVAIGNSLTAGYTNGALYQEGQLNSYPLMLSNQFKLVGGGDFEQPLITNPTLSFGGGTGRLRLGVGAGCDGVVGLAPTADVLDLAVALDHVSGSFGNLGVPSIRSVDINNPLFGTKMNDILGVISGLGMGQNPFYQRFATNPGTSTVITDAVDQNPTFFTFWIGANDVLLNATAGGGAGVTPITDPTNFRTEVSGALNDLTTDGAKGAIATVPNITAIPYFTTIPWNGLVLDQANSDALNAAYAMAPHISFNPGANGFVIADTAALGGLRQIEQGEYVLINASDTIKCGGAGSMSPLPPSFVLDATEVNAVTTATAGYNLAITELAAQYDLALVDVNAFFDEAITGLLYDGVTYSPAFISGGAFSLDGVHPTARGYALISNEFIEAINGKYNSNIPTVQVHQYDGIVFP